MSYVKGKELKDFTRLSIGAMSTLFSYIVIQVLSPMVSDTYLMLVIFLACAAVLFSAILGSIESLEQKGVYRNSYFIICISIAFCLILIFTILPLSSMILGLSTKQGILYCIIVIVILIIGYMGYILPGFLVSIKNLHEGVTTASILVGAFISVSLFYLILYPDYRDTPVISMVSVIAFSVCWLLLPGLFSERIQTMKQAGQYRDSAVIAFVSIAFCFVANFAIFFLVLFASEDLEIMHVVVRLMVLIGWLVLEHAFYVLPGFLGAKIKPPFDKTRQI